MMYIYLLEIKCICEILVLFESGPDVLNLFNLFIFRKHKELLLYHMEKTDSFQLSLPQKVVLRYYSHNTTY